MIQSFHGFLSWKIFQKGALPDQMTFIRITISHASEIKQIFTG